MKHKKELEEIDRMIKQNNSEDIIKYENEKEFKIGDIFEIRKKPPTPYIKNELVNVVCASKLNNGIKNQQLSDKNTFDGNKIVAITGGDGGSGICHYHNSPFNIQSSTCVLIPKYSFLNEKNGPFISKILSKYKKKYNHSYQWNSKRMKNDTVILPINPETGTIDDKFYI